MDWGMFYLFNYFAREEEGLTNGCGLFYLFDSS
jgi:hypothetical protein